MTKEEQQTIFKWLCESLPYTPKCIIQDNQTGDNIQGTLKSLEMSIKQAPILYFDEYDQEIYPIFQVQPIAKPLSMLTEPIKVEGYNEGKEFMSIDYLYEKYPRVTKSKFGMLQDIKLLTEKMEFVIVCELLKMGFFPYDQTYFDKGYLIKESEI